MLYPGLSGGCGRSVCEGSSQSMFRCFGMLGRLTVGTLGSSRSDVQIWPVALFLHGAGLCRIYRDEI